MGVLLAVVAFVLINRNRRFLVGEEDRIIPPDLQRYMAERARAQRTIAVEGASHAITVARPDAVVHPIFEAAAQRVAV